ncbi:TIGR02281 family clan AA aspartic protease [Comamonas sp. Tr-654]|uniref:retropepsin-like aspartic protease family protein n=1 Tax=Comamonas sp. Tr-654 TaxID=2608341 RepID=UPI001422F7F7|nr:TIGR02281 family clan AA aspartic protease [Comamonas sp. Tr-654]NIF85980.1 TIGR02281 family clan AA aspartic protease [Comamonas sp. Tr-654]
MGLLLSIGLTAGGAWGQSVALTGVLGSKALLVIDGSAPKALAVNESHREVRLLQISGDTAVVDIKGRRQTVRLGDAPVSVGSRGGTGGAARSGRLVLIADSRGHFIDRGYINGKTMQYMVDTGASTIAIGRADADRMGLPYEQGVPVLMRTANGTAQGWRIKLDTVKLGEMEVYGMDAVVAPQSMPYVLLGNNLLTQFQMTRRGNEMVLEKN